LVLFFKKEQNCLDHSPCKRKFSLVTAATLRHRVFAFEHTLAAPS
jgi:hypothetical protein